MIITVPTIKREEVNGEIVTTKGKMQLQVDTSLKAHLKWEKYFESTLKCDLTEYVGRIQKSFSKDKVSLLSAMKMLYCFTNSDKLPTFEDFLELFDYDVADEILIEIQKVLKEIGSTVTKN